MRNLHLLPVQADIKLEIEHNAELCRSLYGVKVDILELNDRIPVVRLIQVNNINDQIYTPKQLILFGKEVLAPAMPIITTCHWRPLKLNERHKEDTSNSNKGSIS